MSTEVDCIIQAKWILPIIPTNIVYKQHSLAIKDGKIIDIFPSNQTDCYHSKQLHTLNKHVIMPGFVNSHTHAATSLLKGFADDIDLQKWLTEHIWPAENKLYNKEIFQLGMELAILEFIRSGTTCFNDHYLGYTATVPIVEKMGIRAKLGMFMIESDVIHQYHPSELAKHIEQYLDSSSSNLIGWCLAPHSPYMISNESFQLINKLSNKYNLKIHIHLQEILEEVNNSYKQYGLSPIERLKTLDLINHNLIAVHLTHASNNDIDILEQGKVSIVHCPKSNLKLASGISPMHTFLERSMNVAIATDGSASNNSLDILEECRFASLLAKGTSHNSETLNAMQTLEMATINGAKALGLEKEIGSLEIGKCADIIAIELDHYLTTPIYDLASQIIYASRSLQITDVWVNGVCKLKQKKFTSYDVDSITNRARDFATKALPYAKVSINSIENNSHIS